MPTGWCVWGTGGKGAWWGEARGSGVTWAKLGSRHCRYLWQDLGNCFPSLPTPSGVGIEEAPANRGAGKQEGWCGWDELLSEEMGAQCGSRCVLGQGVRSLRVQRGVVAQQKEPFTYF